MRKKEQQLIDDYLKGDKKSLEILIQQYLKPIYSFVYRYIGGAEEAEDITQEVFLRMWRNLKKFNHQKSFKTWIFSIAKNASIDFFRKKKMTPFSEYENERGENAIVETLIDSSASAGEILERKDLGEKLAKAMEKLSPKYRMTLFLRYNDHFTFREIAESLNEPIDTIKSRHRRALILLKNLLK